MWLVIRYLPTTLFSLRYSAATSTGAKSLLIPSPYTIKMALLVTAVRWHGIDVARREFQTIRDLCPIRIRPSRYAVANRCFLRYQKPCEDKAKGSKDREPPIGYQSTVGFREYVYLHGPFEVACPVKNEVQGRHLLGLAARVNYFGKRGSFVQFVGHELVDTLSEGYTVPFAEANTGAIPGVLQPLDDMAQSVTFDKIDITTDTSLLSSDRRSELTVLPYRAGRAALGYASYARLATEGEYGRG